MKHLGTQTLETSRLILRKFTLDDAPAMHANWASDPEVTKFLTWPVHPNADVSRMVLESWVKAYDDPKDYQWAIELKEIGQPIGSIGVVGQNEQTEMLHIGYCIGQSWWHKGIMTEALQAVMNFLFDEVGANRLEARHDPRNPHSGAVMKKCGMKYEGTMRSAAWNNQGLCDACCYAILKSDR